MNSGVSNQSYLKIDLVDSRFIYLLIYYQALS